MFSFLTERVITTNDSLPNKIKEAGLRTLQTSNLEIEFCS